MFNSCASFSPRPNIFVPPFVEFMNKGNMDRADDNKNFLKKIVAIQLKNDSSGNRVVRYLRHDVEYSGLFSD